MSVQGSTSKVCVVCQEDCAGRPRVKDKQGRYFCEPCYEEARRRMQEKQAVSTKSMETPELAGETCDETAIDEPVVDEFNDDPPMLNDLVDQLAPTMPQTKETPRTQCELCGELIPVDAVLCTSCGYNRKTGEKIAVKKQRARSDWAADSGFFITPVVAGIGLMVVFALLFFAGRTADPAALTLFALTGVLGLGVWIVVLIGAFQTSIGQGLLTFFVPLYIVWFVYGVQHSSYIKWLFGAILVGNVLCSVLIGIKGVELIETQFSEMQF